ncbi:Pimeloyl-ACP methyl ester carboxylesterase [Streptomyces sp. 1222.5]|uniref:alpha/beta fold hydrolase n=1 Tax=unclassified Streptomyces TaxID=2593676 RepID=UPI00089ACA52|nr:MULTISPECIES: alpha/beta hydrolase [unclassified Streptomyces]PKW11923.1 pimeloyl-ACP methyl ester carboxylesterase [Streptomyces sp. 5112.2]SEB66736.1 Pimeloyl-ACP methyl ester carboxylesterase [Streptomyces sp. 1222.5]
MLRQHHRPGLWTSGSDDGRPLVLVHGIRLSAHMWTPVVARLTPEFRITACDLPGHGSLRQERFTLEAAVEVIGAAVSEATAATGRRPVVAGTSLGGITALAYGALGPGGAAGLLCHACTLRTNGPLLLPHRGAALLQRLLGEERSYRLNERALRAALPRESFAGIMAGGISRHAFGEVLAELSRWDSLALASRVTTPVVMANGLADPLFRVQERRFLRRVRDAGTPVRLVHVPGPHLLSLTDPDVFAAVVRRGCEVLSAMTGEQPEAAG